METHAGTNYAKEWREECKKWFAENCENVKCISPVDYYNYGNNESKTGLEIMRFDLNKVKNSDLILVDMNCLRKTIGTNDEIFYAYMLGKPIIGFIDNEVNGMELENLIHPWKFWQTARIEVGQDAMKKAMLHIKDYYLE